MDAYVPFGRSLLAFQEGDADASVDWERDDGLTRTLSAAAFFRQATEMALDRVALERCRGPVLDVGAGAGCHSLALQDRGINVTAVDISEDAVEVMRRRGVKDARRLDVRRYRDDAYETVLILGRSIGLVENLPGLESFLRHLVSLVTPGGRVLLTSVDVLADPATQPYATSRRRQGEYPGVVRARLRFRNAVGPWADWLHVDPSTLITLSAESGWAASIVAESENGNYLTELERPAPGS